jgi:tRNA threonylcarbamoyladenosine biosynthesis protein TsaB
MHSKLKTLYLDTTYDISWGIFNNDHSCLHYESIENKKASLFLHSRIESALTQFNLKLDSSFDQYVHVAGPGFYTGMRVSQVFSGLMRFTKMNVNGFYSYELPYFLGCNDYQWITKAYRGEIFIYSKTLNNEKKELITLDEFKNRDFTQNKIFIHSEFAIDQVMKDKLLDRIETKNFFMKNSTTFLSQILERKKSPSIFYFRPAEEEFKVAHVPQA